MLLMGKLTISMAIFNSYVSHYQRVSETSWSRGPRALTQAIGHLNFKETNVSEVPNASEEHPYVEQSR